MSMIRGTMDEGIPTHVLARGFTKKDLMTSYLVPKNLHDYLRAEYSHYRAAKRSADPWQNSYKCYEILFDTIKIMENELGKRFLKIIEKTGIKTYVDRLKQLLHGDNREEWKTLVTEHFPELMEVLREVKLKILEQMMKIAQKKGKNEDYEMIKIEYDITTEKKTFDWPFTYCACNLHALQPLQKPTPAVLKEEIGDEQDVEGVIYVLGEDKPVHPHIYAIAIEGLKLLIIQDDLIYKLESFIYQAIEHGLDQRTLEFVYELQNSPRIMDEDKDGKKSPRFQFFSPYVLKGQERDEQNKKRGRGRPPGTGKKQKRERKHITVPEKRRTSS